MFPRKLHILRTGFPIGKDLLFDFMVDHQRTSIVEVSQFNLLIMFSSSKDTDGAEFEEGFYYSVIDLKTHRLLKTSVIWDNTPAAFTLKYIPKHKIIICFNEDSFGFLDIARGCTFHFRPIPIPTTFDYIEPLDSLIFCYQEAHRVSGQLIEVKSLRMPCVAMSSIRISDEPVKKILYLPEFDRLLVGHLNHSHFYSINPDRKITKDTIHPVPSFLRDLGFVDLRLDKRNLILCAIQRNIKKGVNQEGDYHHYFKISERGVKYFYKALAPSSSEFLGIVQDRILISYFDLSKYGLIETTPGGIFRRELSQYVLALIKENSMALRCNSDDSLGTLSIWKTWNDDRRIQKGQGNEHLPQSSHHTN